MAVLWLFVLFCVSFGSHLAVVGRCDKTSCRLLYESVDRPLLLKIDTKSVQLPATKRGGAPLVHVIDGLLPGHRYVGDLEGEPVVFVTRGEKQETAVAFVSCNRGFEDGDFKFYSKLEKTERDLTVHLGDQVYVDWLLKSNLTNFDDLVEQLRDVYRKSWVPIRRALLSSPNLMIPDDHEVINNLDVNYPARLETFVAAAKQVYYEFQHALVGNCPTFDCPIFRLEENLAPGLSLLLLDTRFERVFFSRDGSFFGQRQMQFVRDLAKTDSLIVASSIPLLVINRFLCWVAKVVDNEFYPLSRPLFEQSVLEMLQLLNRTTADGVLVGGDLHHFSLSTIAKSNLRSVVSSGMTRQSTTAASSHGSLLFWATSLFPAAVGEFHDNAPESIFLGKNFVVIRKRMGKPIEIEPVFDRDGLRQGKEVIVNWIVENLRIEHYVCFLIVILSIVVAIQRK